MTTPPGTLRDLIHWLMDDRGYASLQALARQTSIPYSTIWAWQDGTRAAEFPPSEKVLRTLAADFGLPERVVFRAAGRAVPEPGEPDADTQRIVHLYSALSAVDRALVTAVARHLVPAAELAPEPEAGGRAAARELLALIEERCPGEWDGADVVQLLTADWFPRYGIEISDDTDEEPEPEDYDPGPECDDEGGMSEYRYLTAPDEP
jgi:transcriptional regulator with XRE-family HTH domain